MVDSVKNYGIAGLSADVELGKAGAQIKGSVSPLALEREKISNVLLNKNKISYLKQLEDELYQNGLDLGKIKIY